MIADQLFAEGFEDNSYLLSPAMVYALCLDDVCQYVGSTFRDFHVRLTECTQ
jgi:hypothetical protein